MTVQVVSDEHAGPEHLVFDCLDARGPGSQVPLIWLRAYPKTRFSALIVTCRTASSDSSVRERFGANQQRAPGTGVGVK